MPGARTTATSKGDAPEVRDRKDRIPSPEAFFVKALDKLPRALGNVIWNTTYAVAWVTLPISILSAIGDLRIVLQWGARLWDFIERHAHALLPALQAIHGLVQGWRAFFEPVYAWVGGMVPFAIPPAVTDMCIALLVCSPAIARYAVERYLLALHDERLRKTKEALPFESAHAQVKADDVLEMSIGDLGKSMGRWATVIGAYRKHERLTKETAVRIRRLIQSRMLLWFAGALWLLTLFVVMLDALAPNF